MSTKKTTICGLFIALSVVGANIKIFSSIAFDAFPGFLGGLILGPVYGGIIGMLGHMFTAITSGFPLSLPVHLIIAVFMFITVFCFSKAYTFIMKKTKNKLLALLIASAVGVMINAPIELIFLVPILGKAACLALLVPLLIGAIANFVLCGIVYYALEGKINVD